MNEVEDKPNKRRGNKAKTKPYHKRAHHLIPSISLSPTTPQTLFASSTTMELQCTPLGWPHFYQEEEMEELRHTVMYTTLELEATIVTAKEEIARREVEMQQMRDLLSKAIKERDEAQSQCRKLVMDNLILQQQLQQNHNQQVTKKDQEATPQSEAYSSELDDDTKEKKPPLVEEVMELAAKRALPAKGKLLQAVMEAGPLLKTLLLAGPLPQWQHPPPKLDTIEIPPLSISSSSPSPTTSLGLNCFTRKRGPEPLCHDSAPPPNLKYPKIVLH